MRIGQTFSQVLAPSLCAMFRLNATPHSVHTSRCLVPPLILYFLAAVWCCAIYSELADAQMPFLDIHWLAANLSVAAVAASAWPLSLSFLCTLQLCAQLEILFLQCLQAVLLCLQAVLLALQLVLLCLQAVLLARSRF